MSRTFGKVRKGTKGIDVIVLQSLFRASCMIGADQKLIEIDGESGNNTVYAINDFKKRMNANGIDVGKVDGVFDEVCWKAIGVM